MPGLGSRLSTYWPTKWPNKWWCWQHTSAKQISIPCYPFALPRLKPKGRVCEERTLGLSSEASNCSDAGTGDLDVLTSHEASLMKVTRILYPHILSAIKSLYPRNQKRKRAYIYRVCSSNGALFLSQVNIVIQFGDFQGFGLVEGIAYSSGRD